jgi:hypothetical protein
MTEHEEMEMLESYNREFNERIAKRPVLNLIQCPKCKGAGGFYSTVAKPEYFKCDLCNGKKYVDNAN